jgi:hypothetical protein
MLTSPNSTKITLNYPSVSNGQILQNWTTEPGSPGISFIPAGSYVFHIHASRTGNPASSVSIYGEFWEVNSTGYNLQKIGSSEQSPALPTTEAEYPLIFVAANTTVLNGADSRIMLRVNTTGVSGNTGVNLIFGEEADSHISLPSNTVDASYFVPYTGATADVNLGYHNITNVNNIINQTRIITNTSASSYLDSLDIGTGTNISSVSVTNNFTSIVSIEQCLTGCHAYDFSSIEIFPSHININSKNVSFDGNITSPTISALQANDSYFNGSVFPQSVNFRNDSINETILRNYTSHIIGINTTHDISVTGTQTISGAGFMPSYVFIRAAVPATNAGSKGEAYFSGLNVLGINTLIEGRNNVAGLMDIDTHNAIVLFSGNSIFAQATVVPTADGITLTWSKNGLPTGTAYIFITFYR